MATPDYLERHGAPAQPDDLVKHNCLLLRYPRSPEYYWVLQTPEGPQKLLVNGHFDADDGDVLTDWALEGRGIANRPHYEVVEHLGSGRLVEILPECPPLAAQFGVLTPHRRLQDPKVRLFADFIARETRGHFG